MIFQHIIYSLANRQGFFTLVRTCKTRLDTTTKVHGCCNIVVQTCHFIIPWQHILSCMNMAVDLSWWFQQWTVCSNNHVQACHIIYFLTIWSCLSSFLYSYGSSCENMQLSRCYTHIIFQRDCQAPLKVTCLKKTK